MLLFLVNRYTDEVLNESWIQMFFFVRTQDPTHLLVPNTLGRSMSSWNSVDLFISASHARHLHNLACLFPIDMLFAPGYRNYTVSQKNWATYLRPITLEILNRSLPNLAQIKVSSFWTSCQSLFKSTLENSGAIWRITLTVNKKVIKVINWQWLCHAVVSATLLTILLS